MDNLSDTSTEMDLFSESADSFDNLLESMDEQINDLYAICRNQNEQIEELNKRLDNLKSIIQSHITSHLNGIFEFIYYIIMEVVQSILFDKNIYSYPDCIRYMLLEGFLGYKYFTTTTQFLRFKFKEPDETKYNYRMEKQSVGIYYIYQYPKVSLE